MNGPKTLSGFVSLPENRSAFLAIREMAEAFLTGKFDQVPVLLYLFGPPGSGKSHLVSALVQEVTRGSPHTAIFLPAGQRNDFRYTAEMMEQARRADVLIVEDVAHLPLQAIEPLIQVIDYRL